ncbi:Protein-disulfide isomerase [Rhodovulum sp. P5]|uniref:DsbA family protein n=1 Tax=Rhodovulum sp. P5 TaxID=1564506 RepID=UPI0009C307A8|nr:thioredoxin domain-containing protein [Rhodovulum sp. P5]ARE38519.1 Protein-disulfide isomerase [Rhodovulum sp. P5]
MRFALVFLLMAQTAHAGLFDARERAALGQELRAYLLSHPEVIGEALAGAEDRRYQAHVDDDLALLNRHAAALFHDNRDWTFGNPAGDVSMVVFIDYGCAACQRALDAAREVLASDPGLRLVVKDTPSGPDMTAARFAEAVRQIAPPETYMQAQDALFAAPDFTPETLNAIARALTLDPAAVTARMAAPETAARLMANRALADALDLGPPSYVLPRTMVRGDVPAIALSRIVESMRRKK